MNEIKYKKPLSIEEQIDYLEKSKSVVYNKCSKEEARHILYKYNYTLIIHENSGDKNFLNFIVEN